jgi:hypothetical protein
MGVSPLLPAALIRRRRTQTRGPAHDEFCCVRSVCSTWREQGRSALDAFDALDTAFAGRTQPAESRLERLLTSLCHLTYLQRVGRILYPCLRNNAGRTYEYVRPRACSAGAVCATTWRSGGHGVLRTNSAADSSALEYSVPHFSDRQKARMEYVARYQSCDCYRWR